MVGVKAMSNQHKLICKLSDSLIEHFKSNTDINGCSQTLDLAEDDSISLTLSVHKAKDDNPTLKLMKAEQRIEELEKQLKDAQMKGFKDGWEASGEGYNAEHGPNADEVVNDYINDLNSGE